MKKQTKKKQVKQTVEINRAYHILLKLEEQVKWNVKKYPHTICAQEYLPTVKVSSHWFTLYIFILYLYLTYAVYETEHHWLVSLVLRHFLSSKCIRWREVLETRKSGWENTITWAVYWLTVFTNIFVELWITVPRTKHIMRHTRPSIHGSHLDLSYIHVSWAQFYSNRVMYDPFTTLRQGVQQNFVCSITEHWLYISSYQEIKLIHI